MWAYSGYRTDDVKAAIVRYYAPATRGITLTSYKNFTFFPITGWHIGPLIDQKAIVLQFGYIDEISKSMDKETQSVFFGLTADMAKKLIASLEKHIAYLEGHAGPSHQH